MILSKKSFAKINLYLEIKGRTANGYHLLDSLMAFLDIYDVITVEENSTLQLEIKGENQIFLQQKWQENIIIKTVNLLSKKYQFTPNLKITLEKNIPVSAGLGGGSSNAATTILLLNQFYNLNLSKQEMLDLALEIGSDVPFCLNGKMAFVSGVGEIIWPADFSQNQLLILLVNPKKELSTKAVFENFSGNFSEDKKRNADLLQLIKEHKNDLQPSAVQIMPEINKILDEISNQKNCYLSRMSGSGASCFGIFQNQEDLELAYQNLTNIFPDFYVKKSVII